MMAVLVVFAVDVPLVAGKAFVGVSFECSLK